MYKRLTFTKVDESRLHDFFTKVGIDMEVTTRHNLTTIRGHVTKAQYTQLVRGISAVKHGENCIRMNMSKIVF